MEGNSETTVFLRRLNTPPVNASEVAFKSPFMKQYLSLLLRLDQFIRQKGTGSPPEFARKMGISERSLYEYLKVLKDLGAPIRFSRQDHSYYYEIDGQFHISFL